MVVPAVLVVLVAGWNVYVGQHDHGRVTGLVVDTGGHPVAGATVMLFEQQFANQVEQARTKTGADGRFGFTSNRSHRLELQASGPAGGASARRSVRLWFRAQDVVVQRPLVVPGA